MWNKCLRLWRDQPHRGKIAPVAGRVPGDQGQPGTLRVGPDKEIWQRSGLCPTRFAILQKRLSREPARIVWQRGEVEKAKRQPIIQIRLRGERSGQLCKDDGIDHNPTTCLSGDKLSLRPGCPDGGVSQDVQENICIEQMQNAYASLVSRMMLSVVTPGRPTPAEERSQAVTSSLEACGLFQVASGSGCSRCCKSFTRSSISARGQSRVASRICFVRSLMTQFLAVSSSFSISHFPSRLCV